MTFNDVSKTEERYYSPPYFYCVDKWLNSALDLVSSHTNSIAYIPVRAHVVGF
jgi:hypothetical protein